MKVYEWRKRRSHHDDLHQQKGKNPEKSVEEGQEKEATAVIEKEEEEVEISPEEEFLEIR